MRARISKWGNSLAVRLPRALTEQVGLKEGGAVEIVANDDAIVLRKPAYTLDDLVAQITPENLHSETDWGKPRGREVW
ncbi:MAG: AbrB/MazE/SpoVT family DNA-binding domain-containing protein [Alphaproteobacteria bacterium]|nr:AbrB/MazE/SpoVT family DNA-binding domain-containing protein [Alphaproteobacteria bacterium]